jgi:hypothetical protein
MDTGKAVLYIKNSLEIEPIMAYLAPFFEVEMARYIVASEIEKRHKAGRS